ncbi:MAG: AMP-binding protein [Ignavibacteriales bacterium]|nr:AMP-binding protein [Ignavibacteriales bacterium]
MKLHNLLENSAAKFPDKNAVENLKGGSISYGELDSLTSVIKNELTKAGVVNGDRVGIYSHKTIDMVSAIFGILKADATYVPVDPGSPPKRNAFIMSDCLVKLVIIEKEFLEGFKEALGCGEVKVHFEFGEQLVIIDGPGKIIRQLLLSMISSVMILMIV